MPDDAPLQRPLPTSLVRQREETIDLLCRAFAADALELPELERRLDVAGAATSPVQLTELVQDLPQHLRGGAAVPAVRASSDVEPRQAGGRRGIILALFGGAEKRGRWDVPETVLSVNIMGGSTLDFREAQLPGPVVTVHAFALMGGVEIVVPPGVRVDINGVALMGGFGMEDADVESSPSDGPLIRIEGLALMGGVEVQVRHPGESAADARRRKRQLRKERRRLRGG